MTKDEIDTIVRAAYGVGIEYDVQRVQTAWVAVADKQPPVTELVPLGLLPYPPLDGKHETYVMEKWVDKETQTVFRSACNRRDLIIYLRSARTAQGVPIPV